MRRVTKFHIDADNEVALNVSTLRKKLDALEVELEEAQEDRAELQVELEATSY